MLLLFKLYSTDGAAKSISNSSSPSFIPSFKMLIVEVPEVAPTGIVMFKLPEKSLELKLPLLSVKDNTKGVVVTVELIILLVRNNFLC